MAYSDLREFVKRLEKEGELKRIRAEVDPVLEITEVVQRVGREAMPQELKPCSSHGSSVGAEAATHNLSALGPALLFEKPKGSRYPLLINAFGRAMRDS